MDIFQTAAIGAISLAAGMYLVKKSGTLRKLCIPAAVVGGLIIAFIATGLHFSGTADLNFDGTLRNVFMMAFFCSVGFMASFRMLKTGGKIVITLLVLATVLIIIQDTVGPALCSVFGMDSKIGLCLGSISLMGGHGTAASYGQTLIEEFGVKNADSIAVAAATFGLAVSGFIGGPLARRRIRQYGLRPDAEDIELSKVVEEKHEIDDPRFLHALILIVVCVGAGTLIVSAFRSVDVTIPVYLGAMIVALFVRNVCDRKNIALPAKEISTLGWISLAMFLVMALMTMKLWEITDLAGAMFLILLVQSAIVALFAYSVVFRYTGKNYESAALVTAVCGFGLGATPNAVANMEAVFAEHGVAPKAYFAVPLVGSVFIDIVNAGILTVFLNILRRRHVPFSAAADGGRRFTLLYQYGITRSWLTESVPGKKE